MSSDGKGGTTPVLASIGSMEYRPAICSNTRAASAVASQRAGATICRPTGRPYWSKPQGMATAGQLVSVMAEVSALPAM